MSARASNPAFGLQNYNKWCDDAH